MNRRPSTRTSLACLSCRNQHLKCDASQPSCSRCQRLARLCSYPESRRTGAYRAASSYRRARGAPNPASPNLHQPSALTPLTSPYLGEHGFPGSKTNDPIWTTRSDATSSQHIGDELLSLYYEHFHCSHRFVLPRGALQDAVDTGSPSIQQLITVMRYIGSFYSNHLRDASDIPSLDAESIDAVDGFSVQTNLLMSLAKSMCSEQDMAEDLLARAIQQAESIGMHTKGFADTTASYDPVLAESWRRTWWMIHVVHLNFAVIRKDFKTTLKSADCEVHLPCEDQSYDTMVCPVYKSV
jgi:Fungal specific transcription factor domain/Fungal Zn(2)-Cys(6) binuclear cluster domain